MNWLSLLGLEAFVARWRANVIEGAIAAEDRLELARLEWLDQKQRLQQMLVLLIAVTGLTVVTLVLVLLPELGRDFAEYRMLLFGTAMILIMIWRPGGILSRREPTLRHIRPEEKA